jgi:small-conductance mechanosensitive channel
MPPTKQHWWTKVIKPESKHAKFLLLALMALVAFEELLELWAPTKDFLNQDSLAIHFGKQSITFYEILKSIFAVVSVFWVAAIISDLGEKYISSIRNMRMGNKAILIKLFQIILYFIAFLLVLNFIGIDLTAFTVFGGAIGIGVGFGLQKITSNFISGLILLFEKSVERDDLVELSDKTIGFIRHMGARYTRVETFDGKEIIIPNEDFITNRVINWTYSNSRCRIDFIIGVSYDSDLEKVLSLMVEAAKEHPRCLQEPEPACYLREFASCAVNFQLYFWIADVTFGRSQVQSDVLFSIWKKFKENNIEIPHPKMDMYIKQLPVQSS